MILLASNYKPSPRARSKQTELNSVFGIVSRKGQSRAILKWQL